MDEVTMLQTINEYGEDAASDYNDSDEVMGWFGWSIDDSAGPGQYTLTITFKSDDAETDSAQWRLVPMEDN